MFDLPLPFRPVIELKVSSLEESVEGKELCASYVYHPEITVRTAYDLKPFPGQ